MDKVILFIAQTPTITVNGLPDILAGPDTLRNVFSVALAVVGGLSVLFLLIGAGRYAVGGGDASQNKQARDTILYSLVGLVLSTSAFFVVQFVLGSINNP